MFYSLTRRTDRQTDWQAGMQQSSVLYNLMQMEVFLSSKKRISLVSTGIAMNRLTLLSHLHGFHDLEGMILLAESVLFVFILLDR